MCGESLFEGIAHHTHRECCASRQSAAWLIAACLLNISNSPSLVNESVTVGGISYDIKIDLITMALRASKFWPFGVLVSVSDGQCIPITQLPYDAWPTACPTLFMLLDGIHDLL